MTGRSSDRLSQSLIPHINDPNCNQDTIDRRLREQVQISGCPLRQLSLTCAHQGRMQWCLTRANLNLNDRSGITFIGDSRWSVKAFEDIQDIIGIFSLINAVFLQLSTFISSQKYFQPSCPSKEREYRLNNNTGPSYRDISSCWISLSQSQTPWSCGLRYRLIWQQKPYGCHLWLIKSMGVHQRYYTH